jgi:signal transduction protein with GAF and PtsI domain
MQQIGEEFLSLLDLVLSTLQVDELLTTVVKEIKGILGAERCTLYLMDSENQVLYSKVLQADNLIEIRIPVSKKSLSGYSAVTQKILHIHDAYDQEELTTIDPELFFDKTWDEKSGYRTRSVLVVPVPAKTRGQLIGVFQALNKPGGFSESDLTAVKNLAYLLGIALHNALLYQTIEEEKKLREYIINDIEEGICILDIHKHILSANYFLEVMSGMRYTLNQMEEAPFFTLFPSFSNTQLEEKIDQVLQEGFSKTALLEVLEVKIVPYLDEKGKVKKLILIFSRI